jgi:hypothetical protein
LFVADSRLALLRGGERRHFMKAIRVEKQGGPEVLKLLDIAPIEAPGPGQAVVRVVAAGVNFVDVGQRSAALIPAKCPSLRAWKARGWLNPLAKASGV